MPTRSTGGFASSNKLLQKKWEERQYKAHKQKMDVMRNRGQVDTRPPQQYPHLVLRLKQIQKEEERQANIDHENQVLLQKMTEIMRKKGRVDNWNDYEPRSLNHTLREREQEKIAMKNMGIATRLEGIRPVYDTDNWEKEFQENHEYLLENWSKDTKEFNLSPRTSKHAPQYQYEDDFENDEDAGSQHLPQISRGSSQHNIKNTSSQSGSMAKLPKINAGKEAIVEQDCKLLFKATKSLVNPHEALNRALIRKTHAHRMTNKERFKEMYDLDLEKELKDVCSRELHVLIDSLLADRAAVDAEDINAAIYDSNMEELVTILVGRNTQAITAINRVYQQMFESTIEDDIKDKVVDEACQKVLTVLVRPKRLIGDIDPGLADQDALDLYEAGNGRFTEEEGEFLKILTLRSMPQVKAMFNSYRMVAGGESVAETMEKDGCSKDHITCVGTLSNVLFNSARLYARQLHDTMDPKNRDFLNVLIARSEIDMALIRRAYKRDFGIELVDDLLQRCGEAGALLAQLAAKGAATTQSQTQGRPGAKVSDAQSKRINGMYIQGPNKRQPIRRPNHIDRDINARANPLSHKGLPPRKPGARGGSPQRSQGASTGFRPMLGGTVIPALHFDPAKDAEAVHMAMKGWSTDEQPLIDVLAYRTNEQRQQIQDKYSEKYEGKNLMEELRTELTGDLEELVVALMLPPAKYDARCLHDAVQGAGTNEATIISILCARTNKELEEIKAAYRDKYGEDLADAIKEDTSGEFKRLLKELLRAERREGEAVDRKLTETDAKELYKEGKFLLEVQAKPFRDVMCRRNRAQVKATMEAYKMLSGHSLETGLREAMLGDEENTYVALAQAIADPVEFHAQRLIDVLKGSATDNTQLVRIIVSRSEIDLADIKARYRELTRRSLEEHLRKDCSGPYKRMLVAIASDK